MRRVFKPKSILNGTFTTRLIIEDDGRAYYNIKPTKHTWRIMRLCKYGKIRTRKKNLNRLRKMFGLWEEAEDEE